MRSVTFVPNWETNPHRQGLVHPEQREREFFLGQFDKRFIEGTLKKKWKTLRVGMMAFDENGVAYASTLSDLVRPCPVFIDRNEAIEDYHRVYGVSKKLVL